MTAPCIRQRRVGCIVDHGLSSPYPWPMRTKLNSYSTPVRHKLLFANLLVLILAGLVNGCMSEHQEADWRWREANPDWNAPGPQDPHPQWNWPRTTAD